MSPSKLLLALITLPAATSYKTSQRLRGTAKQAATPSALKRGAGARLAVNQLDALKEVLATANEKPQGDISDLLAFSQEAELTPSARTTLSAASMATNLTSGMMTGTMMPPRTSDAVYWKH